MVCTDRKCCLKTLQNLLVKKSSNICNYETLRIIRGIGGFRKAFDIFGEDLKMPMQCIGYSELDIYANKTYTANYNTENETILSDIVEFTSNKRNIENLADFDIFDRWISLSVV